MSPYPLEPPRLAADRLLRDHQRAVNDVKLAYQCGDEVAELNAWARLDSTWNALQVARGRVEPVFLRRQAE